MTGSSMISPATSGEILTSVSGWILPVAETSWMIVRRVAGSTVTDRGLFLLPAEILPAAEAQDKYTGDQEIQPAAGFASGHRFRGGDGSSLAAVVQFGRGLHDGFERGHGRQGGGWG